MGLIENKIPAASTPGQVVQVQRFQTSSIITAIGLQISADGTTPQISEGEEILALSITPKASTNILIIDVKVIAANNSANRIVAIPLFKDSGPSALAVSQSTIAITNASVSISLLHSEVSGGTSPINFTVRMGANASGTTWLNGVNAANTYVVTTSSITIWEIAA